MKEYLLNPEFWASIISIVIATVALVQTKRQIRISNKHKLFDRRLEKYTLLSKLLKNYEKQRELLLQKKYLIDPVTLLAALVNAHYYDGFIEYSGDKKSSVNYEKFNSKYELLILKAKEIDILWQNDDCKIVGEFLELYAKVIYCLYLQVEYMYNLLSLKNLILESVQK